MSKEGRQLGVEAIVYKDAVSFPGRTSNGQHLTGSPSLNLRQITDRDKLLAEAAQESPLASLVHELNEKLPYPDPERGYHTYDELAAHLNHQLGVSWVTASRLSGITDRSRAETERELFTFDNAIVAHELLSLMEEGRYTSAIQLLLDPNKPYIGKMFHPGSSHYEMTTTRSIATTIIAFPGNTQLRTIFIEETRAFLEQMRMQANRTREVDRIDGYLTTLSQVTTTNIAIYPDSVTRGPWTTPILQRTLERIQIEAQSGKISLDEVLALDSRVLQGFKHLHEQGQIRVALMNMIVAAHGEDAVTLHGHGGEGAMFSPKNIMIVGSWFRLISGRKPEHS